jgi:hypothetical protein
MASLIRAAIVQAPPAVAAAVALDVGQRLSAVGALLVAGADILDLAAAAEALAEALRDSAGAGVPGVQLRECAVVSQREDFVQKSVASGAIGVLVCPSAPVNNAGAAATHATTAAGEEEEDAWLAQQTWNHPHRPTFFARSWAIALQFVVDNNRAFLVKEADRDRRAAAVAAGLAGAAGGGAAGSATSSTDSLSASTLAAVPTPTTSNAHADDFDLEVEQKFSTCGLSDERAQELFQAVGARRKAGAIVALVDTYYDTPACALVLRDHWLRLRNDEWELKTPLTTAVTAAAATAATVPSPVTTTATTVDKPPTLASGATMTPVLPARKKTGMVATVYREVVGRSAVEATLCEQFGITDWSTLRELVTVSTRRTKLALMCVRASAKGGGCGCS